ncbi:hypothetical protein [Piscinibacter koreensis]|uniref:Lipoprotein n=1 Tax=Piscinibacter koreensis TaxID=2742824 RepID=A0A7Y6NLH0_9BURK|nr:hypothetical protein [Schlegelella koreensis]NUZ05386.1 hypothetical protein [Schlegelella koreensis]
MTRLVPIAILVAALSACASAPPYEGFLRSWSGASEAELVRFWGPPSATTDSAGSRFVTYESRRSFYLPGTHDPSPGPSAMTVQLNCMTRFELVDARVVGWTFQGNGCEGSRSPYRP